MENPLALFHRPCEFIAGAASPESLPPVTAQREIAFIGRSNVGKSSLINALVGQKALARISQRPGATQQLNFFRLDGRLVLVDMPGYGFAKVSKSRKGEWDALIRGYLSGRPTLSRVCLLIDARRGVMPPDEEFMTLLDDSAVTFQIVITKTDALTAMELPILVQAVEQTIAMHAAAHPLVIVTSVRNSHGIEALQEELAHFAVG